MKVNMSFFKHMNIYFISSIIQNLIPFLALPIITSYIIPSEYSMIAMYTLMVSFFTAFIGINAHGAISRKFVDKDKIDFPLYIGNSFIIYFISILIVLSFSFLFIDKLEMVISLSGIWIYVALFASSMQFLISIYMTLLQMKQKSLYYGMFNILKSILNTILILLFVVFYNLGWQGYLEANVIVISFFSLISLLFIIKAKEIKIKYNKEYFNHILKFGVPLIPHALGALAISMTDRILLINLEGEEATGIYQLGWQMALPISLLIEAFKNGYIPWLFEKLKDKLQNTKVVIVTYLMIIGILMITILFIVIINFIILNFFSELYIQSAEVVPYLAYALALSGAYYTVGLLISFAERTATLAILTFITGILNFIFSYYLINLNGMIGAAQGTLLAYLITFFLTWSLSAKVHPMPWFSFWRKNEI